MKNTEKVGIAALASAAEELAVAVLVHTYWSHLQVEQWWQKRSSRPKQPDFQSCPTRQLPSIPGNPTQSTICRTSASI